MTAGSDALRLLASLIEQARVVAEQRPDFGYLSGPTIAEFHAARGHKRRLLRAPNQSGKTVAGAVEANAHSLALPGSVGLVVIPDFESHYPNICEKAWSVIARSELHPACKYVEGRGFYTHGSRGVKFSNGTVWHFRSGQTDVQALEGITADWVWVDEVPTEQHWGGIMRATAARNAPLWMTFTPIGRPVTWLREKVEGNEATGVLPDQEPDGTPRWAQFVPALSVAECFWLTPQRIDQIIEDYPEEERPQRVRGEWEGITTERAFTAFTEAGAVATYQPPPLSASRGLGADHGELAGHEVVLSCAWVEHADWVEVWVTNEYVSTGRSDEREDARGIVAMLHEDGVSPYAVTVAVGDTNSGGKGAKGDSVNAMISRAVAIELGHAPHMPPFLFESADKRGGMMTAGIRLLNVGFARQQVHIHPRCVTLIAALKHWRGGDDRYKHPVDALRYFAVRVMDRSTMPTVKRGVA